MRAHATTSWCAALAAVLCLGLSLPGVGDAFARDGLREPGPPAKRRPKETKKKKKKTKDEAGRKSGKGTPAPRTATVGKPKRWKRCPKNTRSIDGKYCIDRYEAYVNLILDGGKLKRHSPFKPLDGNLNVKALVKKGRMPQAYISQREAAAACANAGKRLCTDSEWLLACKGKKPTTWPYGKEHEPGRCNDRGVSSFNMIFGDGKPVPQSAYTYENLNDDRLNRAKGTCAPAGRFTKCRNSYRVYDMVGNLHEWTGAPGGTFRGGYYLDVHNHGDGCDYVTTAHSPKYHDYSTGFRCCADLR